MKDPHPDKIRKAKNLPPSAKAPYAKPALRVHGSVKTLTQGNTGTGPDWRGRLRRTRPSDRSIKHNIVRVGDHPLGIGLYLFDYLPGYCEACEQGRQFGVMAQEVETVMPEAVSLHPDGYRLVDYAMLGISLGGRDRCA